MRIINRKNEIFFFKFGEEIEDVKNKGAVQFRNLCRMDFNMSGVRSSWYVSAGVNSRAKDLEVTADQLGEWKIAGSTR